MQKKLVFQSSIVALVGIMAAIVHAASADPGNPCGGKAKNPCNPCGGKGGVPGIAVNPCHAKHGTVFYVADPMGRNQVTFTSEAPLEDIESVTERAQSLMAEASRVVLDGFELRSDSEVVRYPDRYSDKRGEAMWDKVMGILDDVEKSECVPF